MTPPDRAPDAATDDAPVDAGAGPSGESPEHDVPEPVLAPNHDLAAGLLALSSTVAEHGVLLTGFPDTKKQFQKRLIAVEESTQAFAGLLDRVATLELGAPDLGTPAETPTTGAPSTRPGAGQPEQPAMAPFDLRELIGWVRENVAKVMEREIPAGRSPNWCRQWWRHAEAIGRLEAARRCWLDANLANTNLAVYFQHLDFQLGVLMAEGGPFRSCRDGKHTPDPVSERWLGHDDPDEDFYAEFDRLRGAPIPAPPTPAGAPHTPHPDHDGGLTPAASPGAAAPMSGGGGVSPAELLQRRNGLGR